MFLRECILLLLVLLVCLPLSAQGQCDQNLKKNDNDPNSYKQRSERCEGLYIQGQSGNVNLLIASFTETFETYNARNGRPLLVDWSAPENLPVKLRAYSLKERTYYRMDSLRPANQASFTWQTDVLSALSIPKGDIGVVGWMQYSIGNRSRDVYLPLRIRQQGSAARGKSYEILIVPTASLKEIILSLYMMGSDGKVIETLQSNAKQTPSFVSMNQSFRVLITAPKKTGLYALHIGAVPQSGSTVTTDLWFYNNQ